MLWGIGISRASGAAAMRLTVLSLVWITFLVDLSDGDSVTQRVPYLTQTEGEDVTLNCTYTGSPNYMSWYRQYPGRQPEFAVWTYTSADSEEKADFAQIRFSTAFQRTDKFYQLTISDILLSDAAVYYCATRLTVTRTS
ncbi:hypothetical protein chiPu_0018526 [Chiloscyllium punctatum]|uniref:Ig-like domain-containing protein n=1 Tax=Chiloscyllium punctatum TaxID=137246 RepID=A0A401RNS8_CHIPU|nr:hypothetical protein [Chiloscyllium punctatum]